MAEDLSDPRPVLNADRRRVFGAAGRQLALVCECADGECRRTILMTPEEYDALRPQLVLHPGHVASDAGEQRLAG